MPIKIPNQLPATSHLEQENIFVMTETRAISQDIRPLKIMILNLMPTKITTETQLLRLLGNTPLQVDIELVKMESYTSKNTPPEHLLAFYKSFSEVKHKKFDGLVITGAPVEHLDFEKVDYWNELCDIMSWSLKNVTSTLHICWGAQAGVYFHYGIKKIPLDKKISGVYAHNVINNRKMLLRGFDNTFLSPHSRWSISCEESIRNCPQLEILAESKDAGIHIVTSEKGRHIFVFGHMEYDANTLANEYFRDIEKDTATPMPYNYFPEDDPEKTPILTWRAHANLLFSNWLNYHVYQATPYNITEIKEM